MSAVAITAGARGEASVPQLRTILLTDLCDSIQLVERIGDSAAAELFREHDLLVLQLQQQWRGRLIDRSDGMLLLFERPIDGLGFALDYHRGLRELGRTRDIDLKARAGLHVGEVLTWRNSDEAVKVGAKPLEVEGLAKPMAARLMTLARPGQVLVSAVAEPLAQRSARELGERGRHLLWKSHGRWRFKGLPNAQEVFEAGEPGIAPLRMPQPTPKAWRDIPLWRRPAALVAELAIVLAIGLGIWFIGRPQPAIAFNERDWVVVADLRNLTGQPVLDDSLEQAFRISLEQSRYVNVLSDLKARQTLERMRLPPDTKLDRGVASEIAIRDGARAVILPTVAEIGGHVRVSAEVIDPHSQTTVYSEYADGRGASSALGSIDTITAGLRERLGEAMAAVNKNSVPLPQVTTGNLDALKAYALGQKAYLEGEYSDAVSLFERATDIDPKFALAYVGGLRAHWAMADAGAGLPLLKKAMALKDRLPSREALYLEAWAAEFDPKYDAPGKWRTLANLYPDYYAGSANYAGSLLGENKFAEAIEFANRVTVPQNPLRGIGFDYVGRAELGQEDYDLAARMFDQAMRLGHASATRRRADVAAVKRQFDEAYQLLAKEPGESNARHFEYIAFAVDQGKWDIAQEAIATALGDTHNKQAQLYRVYQLSNAVLAYLRGNESGFDRRIVAVADMALAALEEGSENANDRYDDAYLALAAAYVGQRGGNTELASRILSELGAFPDVMSHPKVGELSEIVRAMQELEEGEVTTALRRLEELVNGRELFQTHAALLEAYIANGSPEAALRESQWLQRHRGLAYIELPGVQSFQALNVADTNLAKLRSAELLSGLGRKNEAKQEMQVFVQTWPVSSMPNYLRRRVSAILPASKQ